MERIKNARDAREIRRTTRLQFLKLIDSQRKITRIQKIARPEKTRRKRENRSRDFSPSGRKNVKFFDGDADSSRNRREANESGLRNANLRRIGGKGKRGDRLRQDRNMTHGSVSWAICRNRLLALGAKDGGCASLIHPAATGNAFREANPRNEMNGAVCSFPQISLSAVSDFHFLDTKSFDF